MNRSVTSILFTAAIFSVATVWGADPSTTPAVTADKAEAKAPAVAEPAKPAAAPIPHKLEVMPPQFGQFASLVRYADANGDMIIDDQEAEAAIKVLGDCMREQFKRRNQAILNMYDLDKDGRLSTEELLKMKEKFRASAENARHPVTRPQIGAMAPNGKLSPTLEKNNRPGPFKAEAGPAPKPETTPAATAPAPAPTPAK